MTHQNTGSSKRFEGLAAIPMRQSAVYVYRSPRSHGGAILERSKSSTNEQAIRASFHLLGWKERREKKKKRGSQLRILALIRTGQLSTHSAIVRVCGYVPHVIKY